MRAMSVFRYQNVLCMYAIQDCEFRRVIVRGTPNILGRTDIDGSIRLTYNCAYTLDSLYTLALNDQVVQRQNVLLFV